VLSQGYKDFRPQKSRKRSDVYKWRERRGETGLQRKPAWLFWMQVVILPTVLSPMKEAGSARMPSFLLDKKGRQADRGARRIRATAVLNI